MQQSSAVRHPRCETHPLTTQAEFDRARDRLRELAKRWRAQPWYLRTVGQAPGPIAHEASAFADVLEAGDPGGALLQLRDTVETLIKFCALVFACELIAQGEPADAQEARRALLGRPLSLGTWWAAARSLGERIAGRSPAFGGRGLAGVFGSSDVRKAMDGFVKARNDEIGHGAFQRDPNEAVDTVEKVAFNKETGTAFIFSAFGAVRWPTLLAEKNDAQIDLTGADAIQNWHDNNPPHEGAHAAAWPTLVVFDGQQRIDLAPFVAARICDQCKHRDVFLFDNYDAKKAKADFLDYVQGHKSRARDDGVAGHLGEMGSAATAPTDALDIGTLSRLAVEALEAASNDTRYQSPAYLREPLFETIATTARSVTWLQAPAHVGKSVFARGLADPLAEPRDPPPADRFGDLAVAGLFIKREWRSDLTLLRIRLTDALIRALDINPDHRDRLPRLEAEAPAKPRLLAELLAAALRLNGRPGIERLLVVIDGLDEVEPSENGLVVLDFLPPQEALPDGVHLLLTSRRAGDADCPRWISDRLATRLAGAVTVRRLDLADPGYLALMRAYADGALDRTRRFDDATFHKALSKAQGLFLYFSFLIDQIALGRLAVDALDEQPEGAGLYAKFLANFKGDMGYRRLGEEAELVLYALAAEELAHDWLFGAGLKRDYAGEPLLVGDSDWRGLPLDELAQTLDRDGPDGKPTGFFLYVVYRLKAVIGVNRGGAGEAHFRLWLKDLAKALASDSTSLARLKIYHARAATALLDAREPAAPALAHAMLSGSEPVIRRAVIEDDLVDLLLDHSAFLQTDDMRLEEAIHASNAMVATLLHRKGRMGGLEFAAENALAGAYMNRAVAKQQAIGPAEAIPDYDAAISLRAGLRDALRAEGLAWPPQFQNDLAKAYMNRAVAKAEAIGPAAAIPDLNVTLQLMENLRRQVGEKIWAQAPEWRNLTQTIHQNLRIAQASPMSGDLKPPGARREERGLGSWLARLFGRL
jgi:hypothetical protein